jgi:hypothetical protein
MGFTIWKQVLNVVDVQQEIMLPAGAEILCARDQQEQICIWFRCDPDAPKSPRRFAIVGTGHPAPSQQESRYLGTASLLGGQFMFHVFEKPQ